MCLHKTEIENLYSDGFCQNENRTLPVIAQNGNLICRGCSSSWKTWLAKTAVGIASDVVEFVNNNVQMYKLCEFVTKLVDKDNQENFFSKLSSIRSLSHNFECGFIEGGFELTSFFMRQQVVKNAIKNALCSMI